MFPIPNLERSSLLIAQTPLTCTSYVTNTEKTTLNEAIIIRTHWTRSFTTTDNQLYYYLYNMKARIGFSVLRKWSSIFVPWEHSFGMKNKTISIWNSVLFLRVSFSAFLVLLSISNAFLFQLNSVFFVFHFPFYFSLWTILFIPVRA